MKDTIVRIAFLALCTISLVGIFTSSTGCLSEDEHQHTEEKHEEEEEEEVPETTPLPDAEQNTRGCSWDSSGRVCVHHVCSGFCTITATAYAAFQEMDRLPFRLMNEEQKETTLGGIMELMGLVHRYSRDIRSKADKRYLDTQHDAADEMDAYTVVTDFPRAEWTSSANLGDVPACDPFFDTFEEYSLMIEGILNDIDEGKEDVDISGMVEAFEDFLEESMSLCTQNADMAEDEVAFREGTFTLQGDDFSSIF